MSRRHAVLLLLAALPGCNPELVPTMHPGESCLGCHRRGGEAYLIPFSAAGTVFPAPDSPVTAGLRDLEVRLVDATGTRVVLHTNAAGNFYTQQALTFPVQAEVVDGSRSAHQMQPVTAGACATCHTLPPQNGAPGRIHAP
jgi:hypothetical protein